MEGFDPLTIFGAERAELYDESPRGDEAETVAFLERVAGGGAPAPGRDVAREGERF